MTNTKRIDEANDSTEALNIAFRNLAALSPSGKPLSMNHLRAKAGIPSRGYFSLVMRGQRILNKKYGDTVARALQLKGFEHDLFIALLDFDHETKRDKKEEIQRRIARLKKILCIDKAAIMPPSLGSEAVVGDVFCAFSLFSDGAYEKDILDLFSSQQSLSVKTALKSLCDEGYLKNVDGKYSVVKRGVIYTQGEEHVVPAGYMKSSFIEAAEIASSINDYLGQCYLTSLTISLKQADYRRLMDDFRKKTMELATAADDDHGDQVVRINVSVYPVIPALTSKASARTKDQAIS